jgi:hypothetical protein
MEGFAEPGNPAGIEIEARLANANVGLLEIESDVEMRAGSGNFARAVDQFVEADPGETAKPAADGGEPRIEEEIGNG